MRALYEPITKAVTPGWSRLAPAPWIPVAVALAGIGWGSNQVTPLLLVYTHTLGAGTGTLAALFGVYIVGLIPGLLVAGPISDARGRRPVVLSAVVLSLVATVAMIAGAGNLPLLFLGRLAAGVSSGMVFSAGTSWLRETSLPPVGTADAGTAARRAAVAVTAGFGLGPLGAGLLAQWAPAPTVVAYLPHVAMMALTVPALALVPETLLPTSRHRVRFSAPEIRLPRFTRVIAPVAPWVFAAPSVVLAVLPEILGVGHAPDGIALTAVVIAILCLAGVAIQPLARRLHAEAGPTRTAGAGLVAATTGLGLSAVTAALGEAWLLVPCALLLGGAYGLCLVAGLIEVQTLADAGGLARLTAFYYALTYLGFALPYVLAAAAPLAGYPVLLAGTAVLAVATAALIRLTGRTR